MADEKKLLLDQVTKSLETSDTTPLIALLSQQRTSDIAEIVEILDNEDRRIVFDCLEAELSAEVLEKVDEATRSELFEILGDKELAEIVTELDPDDAADILSEMDSGDVKDVLECFETSESDQIKKLMSYDEDCAGGIMDPEVISVDKDLTVAEVIQEIRKADVDEDFYYAYVVDQSKRFVGDISIISLLTNNEDIKVGDICNRDSVYITADADQEEVRNIFSKNDLIAAVVLDDHHKLIGRITADRIIEVAEEEAAEDMFAMAGTDADELDKVSVFNAAKIRMTWLLPCLIGTGFTALLMMLFKQSNPAIYLVASAFVPMIAAISGNAGLQTSTIVVTGLATGHLAALKITQVFTREVRIAIIVAISCGILGSISCIGLLFFKISQHTIQPLKIATAFGIGMFSAIMVATTLGLFLPFFFRKVRIDPAISSGPLVTTANDSISVAIYLSLTILLAS